MAHHVFKGLPDDVFEHSIDGELRATIKGMHLAEYLSQVMDSAPKTDTVDGIAAPLPKAKKKAKRT